jgi:hypothetical protein
MTDQLTRKDIDPFDDVWKISGSDIDFEALFEYYHREPEKIILESGVILTRNDSLFKLHFRMDSNPDKIYDYFVSYNELFEILKDDDVRKDLIVKFL